jgi:sortase B
MSIKGFLNENKKKLILVCLSIVVVAGTIAAIFAPGFAAGHVEPTSEDRAEQIFYELLQSATSGEPPSGAQFSSRTLAENPWDGFIEEEIVLLSLEERLRIWYEEYGIRVPEKELDFDVLYSANRHIYAWIYIPNTRINYPVLQHSVENSFYLHHNLDGTRGYPGAIYTELFNTTTFLDRMTVVYGHNMREGTMFADLHRFADAAFFEENPHIFVYTEDDIFVYQIISARRTTDNHILFAYDLFKDNSFLGYLNNITNAQAVIGIADDTIGFTADSRIIALSTCVTGSPRERFVVHGILIEREGFYQPRPW